MLKKQTVWLLTMLSLIIVLSVYYMTSPTPPSSSQMAVTNNHQKDKSKSDKKKDTPKADQNQTSKQASAPVGKGKVTDISGTATFAAAKVKKMDTRSKQEAQLTQTIASDKASPQEKVQATDKLKQLRHLSSKEQMLESLIVAKGFGKDALVNVNGDQIRIYVEANSLSDKQAAQILHLVEGQLNMSTSNIYVTYKPGKAE